VIRSLVGVTGVEILAGAGVTPMNARELVQKTGVREVHGSCKKTLDDGSLVTDAASVRQMIDQTLTL
jgi:copper homeostasis protein CutC